jgi:hypothetical protein
MNKYVLSSVDDTLNAMPGHDDGSVVLCLDHLHDLRKKIPGSGSDRVFDARLFPGGDEFLCESCEDSRDSGRDSLLAATSDPWKWCRAERAPTLYRLTVSHEFARLNRIASRLAGVAATVVAILGYREWERFSAPYLGDSWIAKLPLLVVAYITFRLGSRWLLTGKLSWSHDAAVEQGVGPDGRSPSVPARRSTP